MPKLIITRGIPASGKTTWARAWVAEDIENRARVNRDDLRAMTLDGEFKQGVTEQRIIASRDALVKALLGRGLDVVVDDTNLPNRTVRDLMRLARLAGAEFEVKDFTDANLDACISRDALRDKPVGKAVIRDMHNRFIKGKPYPLPLPEEPEFSAGNFEPYVPDESLTPAVIVDIDGTLALKGDRSPYDESRVHEDRPNMPVIGTVYALYGHGYEIVLVSGRQDSCRRATELWLDTHLGLRYADLFMRKAGDFRRDYEVKAEIFDNEIRHNYNVLAVLDDRSQVVRMWRGMGLTCLQVADGEF